MYMHAASRSGGGRSVGIPAPVAASVTWTKMIFRQESEGSGVSEEASSVQ